ncbi:hypothetical protein, partial [Streptomyces cellulosae]|uniref:hypothetical protein n=1 Tax=Streptomyces cellulosae TaxID=1968 RepID=UPI0004CAAB2F
MYEMCVGPETKTGAPVWHVVERHRGNSLCGADLSGAPRSAGTETDRHCLPCMARFQECLEASNGGRVN